MTNYVKIFDTTLRDGEQSPGATMTSAEKLEVAHNLARLGVVQAGGRFVEQQQLGFGGQRARDFQPLQRAVGHGV